MKQYDPFVSALCASALWLAIAFAPEVSCAEIVSAQGPVTTFRLLREEPTAYLTPNGRAMLEATPVDRARVIVARSAQVSTFDPATAKPGDRVVIDIAPGESYVAILDAVTSAGPHYPELINWRGRLEVFDDSYVLLGFRRTAQGAVGVGGKIFFGGRFVTFEPEGSDTGAVLIREIVSTALEGAPGRQESTFDGIAPSAPREPHDEIERSTPK